MLAVVEDQVPQVLLFQFSIGDADVVCQHCRSHRQDEQVSILYWRCPSDVISPADYLSKWVFQFSIGDAIVCAPT